MTRDLKAVFIDYSGTTVQEGGLDMKEAVMRISKNCDLHDPVEMMKIWWGTIKTLEEASFMDTYISEEGILDKALNIFKEKYHLSDDFEDLKKLINRAWTYAPVFDDTKYFFDNCPVPLYVITNNGLEYVKKAMELNDLHPAGIICSDVIRAYKPHKELFDYALKVAGCEAEEAVHIGDSYQSDICGAKSAGINAILVDRKCEKAYGDVMVVNSLKECIDLFRR